MLKIPESTYLWFSFFPLVGLGKFGGLAKLYFDEPPSDRSDATIKMEYHGLGKNNFYSGSVFIPKEGGNEEDDGWIVAFVHNEETNMFLK